MSSFSSTVTKKGQATVPAEIRQAFGIHEGDKLVWILENPKEKKVIVRKATPLDLDFAASVSATLNEWDSKEDQDAYKDL